ARRAGAGGRVVALGTIGDMAPGILAADAGLAWRSAHGPSATGRFIADCLRGGRPARALPGTPGAELLHPARFGCDSLGAVVEPEELGRAIGELVRPECLAAAQAAAEGVAPALAFDAFLDRLEAALGAQHPAT